jgi:hypothetical protein
MQKISHSAASSSGGYALAPSHSGTTHLAGTGCEPAGGDPAGARPAAGPVPAVVLSFNNPPFQQAKEDLLAAATEADPAGSPASLPSRPR